ncbi:MAG: putative inorganic carbon transporter subunit DabA, partial [Pseudomonadota bacterium]
MTTENILESGMHAALSAAADNAARQIPPLWPLASHVAVNPFLGQTSQTLAETGAHLARVGAVPVTMPRAYYSERIASGDITETDLADALAASSHAGKPVDVTTLKTAAGEHRPAPQALPNVADLAAEATDRDWPGLIADRLGVWMAGYFDQGQALWAAPRAKSAWSTFRAHATHDLVPEIMGLRNFAAFVADTPQDPGAAIARAVNRLGIDDAALDTYFHQLLLSLGGWAQCARYHLWRAELAEKTDGTITDLLAIRLVWEEALFVQHAAGIGDKWSKVCASHAAPVAPTRDDVIDEILQEAAERAGQRTIADTLAAPTPDIAETRPALQAAFCIDVRSEVFRRALESVDPSIRTLGFAGFFGVFAKHRRFASDVEELRLPVLLNPTITSSSGNETAEAADLAARLAARAKRAWGRFKLATVSSFAFVEAMGPVYVGKLVRDALGFNPMPVPNDPKPRFDPELDLETRIGAAETVLRAMSLTDGFARLVILAGHGANVVNNPHASGLHCGACGGYSGEVNARLLASLLNETEVRSGLAARGILVPADTLFVGALHDTTTDAVTLYEADNPAPDHAGDLRQARHWLAAAGKVTRGDRALRLPRADNDGDIAARATDWAEVRPEWAL